MKVREMVTSQLELVQVVSPSDGASGECERREWDGVRDESMIEGVLGDANGLTSGGEPPMG